MRSRSCSITTHDATKEQIWTLWTDINNWHQLKADIEWAKLNGPFMQGDSFIIKPQGAKETTFVIEKCIPYQEFTDSTRLFDATMFSFHKLEETNEGLNVAVAICISGPLTFMWRKIFGEDMVKNLPDNIIAQIQQATNH